MGVKLGNGKWAIKEDKLLAYNDNSGRFFNKEFDFSRGSSATYVAKDGLIKTANDDTPRIDFSDTPKGALLLEPQSTNLIPYSNLNFGTSSVPDGWIVGFGTGTYSHTPTNYKGQPAVIHRQETTGRSYLRVLFTGTNAEHTIRVEFDKSRCLNMENSDPIIATINVTNSETKFWSDVDANGVLEFQTTFGADASGELRIGLGVIGNEGGNKTLVWGMPQIELGSFATSYIPTFGSTATRNADVCNNSGSAQDFNSEEGVLYAEISAFSNNLEYRILSVSDGSTNNRAYLQYTNLSNQIKFVYKVGSVTQAGIGTGGFDIVDYHKIACKWKANDFALWIDGNEIGTDTNGSVNPKGTFTQLNFDDGAGNADFYGNIRDLQVFTEALTDEQLQKLTS